MLRVKISNAKLPSWYTILEVCILLGSLSGVKVHRHRRANGNDYFSREDSCFSVSMQARVGPPRSCAGLGASTRPAISFSGPEQPAINNRKMTIESNEISEHRRVPKRTLWHLTGENYLSIILGVNWKPTCTLRDPCGPNGPNITRPTISFSGLQHPTSNNRKMTIEFNGILEHRRVPKRTLQHLIGELPINHPRCQVTVYQGILLGPSGPNGCNHETRDISFRILATRY